MASREVRRQIIGIFSLIQLELAIGLHLVDSFKRLYIVNYTIKLRAGNVAR